MTHCSRIGIDFPVISALESFVTEEMDCLVVNTRELLGGVSFCFDMLQTISLVPAMGEDIEGDLTADRVARDKSAMKFRSRCQRSIRKTHVSKLLPQRLDHGLPASTLLVPSLIFISLRVCSVTPHGTDIDHSGPELDECTSHRRQAFESRDVSQAELGKPLILLLSQPLNEGVRRQLFTKTVGGETVLGEAEVEHGSDRTFGGAELFLLLL